MPPRPMRRATIAASLAGAVGAALLAAGPVAAHTGHPADGLVDGVVHPLLGPDHLLAMLAVGVVAALVADRRRAWLLPAAFVVGMIAGGSVGIAGVTFPGIELAVAASVVLLGLAVTGAVDTAQRWLPGVVVLFGAAHGLAHGGELPAGATPLAYVGGFVLATVALHGLGAVGGAQLRNRATVRAAAGTAVAAAGLGLVALS